MIARLLVVGALALPVADSSSQLWVSSPTIYAIAINGGKDFNEPLVAIKFDGTIEYGAHYTPDAAAKVFWEHLGKNAPCRKENQ